MAITWKIIRRVLAAVEQHNSQYLEPAVTLVAKQHRSPFHVLITTIISLRTKDEVTAAAAARIFAAAETPTAMRRLSEERIGQLIYPAGFYKTKARTIRNLCATLLDQYGGKVPDDLDELLKLKGVGRKTANLVLIEGYNKEGMCIDTHCHRIPNRWGLIKSRNPEETEMAMRAHLPTDLWTRFNVNLVTFGQHQCVPVSPKCSTCPLDSLCPKVGVTVHR